jgi:type II secretory pathway component GspD/PulD (secretin)
MVFQANKWGWKLLAAKLLLAPVLAGSLAAPVFAQSGSKAPPAVSKSSDPKELLKQGRKALSEGRYDDACALANAAASHNATGRWGLLGDTPDSLLKDVQSARQKADRATADVLTKEAKTLFTRPARTDAERSANLEMASEKIDRAITLGGSSGWVDDLNPFVDKPETLKREIDAARIALNGSLARADARNTTPTAKGSKPGTTPIRPTRFETEPNALPLPGGTAGVEKAKAVELMKTGRELLAEGKLLEARAQFLEAARKGGTFTLAEDNPDKCLAEVAEKGKQNVDKLVAEAQKCAAAKDYAKAETALLSAKQMAASLNLWTRGIDLELEAIRTQAGQKTVSADVPGLPGMPTTVDAPKAESLKVEPPATISQSAPLPDIPSLELPGGSPKTESVKVNKPIASQPVVAEKKPDIGRKLLDLATAELKRGELEMARKLVMEVHNGEFGLKDDAQKLLVMIDAETKVVKTKDAVATLDTAVQAFSAKRYEDAEKLLVAIDRNALPPAKQNQYEEIRKSIANEMTKRSDTAKAAGGLIPSTPTTNTPPSGVLEQAKTMADAELQQLRMEGLQVQSEALKAFERGETDLAVQRLTDFTTKVKASRLSPARQKMLLDPVEAKLDNFRLIKRQVDLYTKDVKEKQERMESRIAKSTAEQQKQEEIAKRVRVIHELMDKKQFAEAERVAMQAKQLDPDNETLALIYTLARNNRRVEDARRIKSEREEFVLEGLNSADTVGQVATDNDPVKVNILRSQQNRNRPGGDYVYQKPKTEVERQIEMKLENKLTLEFKQASLREVIDKFAEMAKINVSVDEPAIAAELDLEKVLVTEKITQPISLRSVMQLILDKYRLQYVIENGAVNITTQKKAKGRMYTKVYSVMELVTPIPDFAQPEHASFDKTTTRHNVATQQPWLSANANANGLGGGQLVSGAQPWASSNSGGGISGRGGILENQSVPGTPQNHPIGASATLAPTKANHSEQLIKLIKGMVRPHTWDEAGGAGKLTYYDIGGALVVNQTADVISEVNELLESLRRLQDLSISVEVRIVSLSEAFFERIGVDFQMNIKTKGTENFERSLTTGSFRPVPFINDINTTGVVTGWSPATGFTSDLDVPIRPNTYGFSVPPFGGYPGNGNGGLNLGLAFLNDIQVFMFLEAAAGDRRTNTMSAPKITMFNGQTSTISFVESTFFTTGLSILNVGGQFVYQPQNTPFPTTAQTVAVQGVVSSDRRFVRLTIAPNLVELSSATVPLFPVTAFITPVFEGGSQGTPIPFTQFFQQPSVSTITINSTVVVPDGGTVLLGGLKTMSEGRNEFGPPVLSNIPYLNRLFRNTGIGRETRHVMFMVTPRIIITSEEEEVQTRDQQGLGTGN